MKLIAIDPGTTKSAYVIYDIDAKEIDDAGIEDNERLAAQLPTLEARAKGAGVHMAIETIKSYGNVIGDSVLETCVWVGRFIATFDGPYTRLYRKTVVSHICKNPRAKDKNVRQALIDRFGGKGKAIGVKKSPGPLYGIKKDMWSALAVALTYVDLNCEMDFLQ